MSACFSVRDRDLVLVVPTIGLVGRAGACFDNQVMLGMHIVVVCNVYSSVSAFDDPTTKRKSY
jgi:hypothetical protein